MQERTMTIMFQKNLTVHEMRPLVNRGPDSLGHHPQTEVLIASPLGTQYRGPVIVGENTPHHGGLFLALSLEQSRELAHLLTQIAERLDQSQG